MCSDESSFCDRCGTELGGALHVRDGDRHYCIACCPIHLDATPEIPLALEMTENVSGPVESEWSRARRVAQAAIKFVASFGVCFGLCVVQLQPFRLDEGIGGAVVAILLGLCAVPLATLTIISQSRRLATPGYPIRLRVHRGYLCFDVDGKLQQVALQKIRFYEDTDKVLYPQTSNTALSQLYLCTRNWLIACGSSVRARADWEKLLHVIRAKRIPGTSLGTTSRFIIISAFIGKIVGALLGMQWKGDVFGGLIGCLLGFLLSRVWCSSLPAARIQ